MGTSGMTEEKIIGNDNYRYKFIPNWSKGLPKKSWPTAVAVDSKGTSVHQTGPAEWKAKIAEQLVSIEN